MRTVAALVFVLVSCSRAPPAPSPRAASGPSRADAAPANKVVGPVFEEGIASYYSDKLAGRKTASGEPYEPSKMTCAHRKLRFGTVVEVERKKNGKKARCTVNDRGPYAKARIIDLSRAVAEALDIEGVAQVRLREVSLPR